MRNVVSFFIGLFLTAGVFAQTTWKSDKNHSQVSFAITHMGISEVEGTFNKFDATIVASEKDFSDAVFTVNIEMGSVDTHVEMRDNHLKSADFFDVEKFPNMVFKSNGIERVSKDHFKLKGNLTLHGVTKSVTLEMWYRGSVEGEKGIVTGFQFTGSLNRSDFNIGAEFPEMVLSDKVKIKMDAEFKKQ